MELVQLIELHEDEYFQSPLKEDTLRILLSFLPREAYDKLLYGDAHARLRSPCARNVREVRTDIDDIIDVADLFNSHNREEPPNPAEVAQVPALVDSG